jgi:proteasome lid subunit RPN8/RPN11
VVNISPDLVEKMLEEAKAAYPFECCGILVGSNGAEKEIHEICPVENKNKVRAHDRYEIDSKKFDVIDREAAKKGLNIIGIYHSHPDHPAEPSAFDKDCACAWREYSYIIVSIRNKEETEIRSWCFDAETKSVEEEELIIKKSDLR